MKHPNWLFIFAGNPDRDEANQIAVEITGSEHDRNTYDTPCVPADGPNDAEPTDWACSTPATHRMVAKMQDNMPRVINTIQFFRCDAATKVLLLTNNEYVNTQAQHYYGNPFSFEDALEVVGKKRRVLPMEG